MIIRPNERPGADPARAHLNRYLVVFADEESPKEVEFQASADEDARQIAEKLYAGWRWTLHRVGDDGARVEVHSRRDVPMPPVPAPTGEAPAPASPRRNGSSGEAPAPPPAPADQPPMGFGDMPMRS